MVRAAVGGVIAGLVGAAIWAAIGYFGQTEVGFVAWGIGFLVGLGVAMGADEELGMGTGLLAIGISIGSIALGKYMVFYFLTANIVAGVNEIEIDNNSLVHSVAEELVEERQLTSPELPEMTEFTEIPDEQQYPPGIWNEAQEKFNELSPEDVEARRQVAIAQREQIAELVGEMAMSGVGFKEMFSAFDLLWCLLAAVTAFRLGGGDED